MFAQINLTDGFVVDDFIRGAGSKHGPFADDVGVIGNAQGFAHVVVGDEYADAALFEEADDLLDLQNGNRVDAGERFIEQDEAWFGSQCAGDFYAAAFTTGECCGTAVTDVLDSQLVEQCFETVTLFVSAELLELQYGEDVFFDGELAKDGGFLRQVGDTPCARADESASARALHRPA